MCLLFETIRIEDGIAENMELHEARMRRSQQALFGKTSDVDLAGILSQANVPATGLFRCKIIYGKEITGIEFFPYQVRPIRKIKIVDASDIDYAHKYFDRSPFERLKSAHADCDELLLLRAGLVTDTTFSNVAFYDGSEWHTPEIPLLHGTRRQSLLNLGKIKTKKIHRNTVFSFQKIALINAMLRLGDCTLEGSTLKI